MKHYRSVFTSVLLVLAAWYGALANPSVRMEDKIRIKEAITIRNTLGESVWSGIRNAPFVILLVTEEFEYLFYHPYPSSDFTFLEDDDITGSKIYYRPQQFSIQFEATFPAVNGVNTVVMGIPENTQSNHSSRWVLTLLHENFHQYQSYQPYHYTHINDLDLSGGDTTGMWQLNYPLPYEDARVNSVYDTYVSELLKCIKEDSGPSEDQIKKLEEARLAFKKSLSPKDYSYFSFQLWTEGVARYTEYKYLEALQDYEPSSEFKALDDYMPFTSLKEQFIQGETKKLKDWTLAEHKRTVIYSLGLAEGMVLDRLRPNWRAYYFSEKFNIKKTLEH